VFYVLPRWFARLSAWFASFEDAQGSYWHARRHTHIRSFSLFLLCLYLAVIVMTSGERQAALIPVRLACGYATPLLALLLVGPRTAMLMMGLNTLPLIARLSGMSISFTDGALELLFFAFFNVILPLSVLRLLVTLDRISRSFAEANIQLQRSMALYEDMFENNGMASMICEADGRIVRANARASELTGLSGTQLATTGLDQLLQAGLDDLCDTDAPGSHWDLHRPDGELRTVRLHITHLPQSSHLLVSLIDATGLAQMRAELDASRQEATYLVRHDALTGLPNRAHFLALLQDKVNLAALNGSRVHALSIKLNEVRQVNERLGIQAGDELLRQFGEWIAQDLGRDFLIGRTRGGVFCLILQDVLDPVVAQLKLQACVAMLPESLRLRQEELALSYYTGVSTYPVNAHSAADLVRFSEYALNTARRNQIRTIVHFDENQAEAARRLINLEIALRNGLKLGALELHYQPKVDGAGQIVSMEALVRWHDSVLGRIAPDEFVTMAERCGLIHEITQFALREACRQIQAWLLNGHAVPVAVNLSARDMARPELVQGLIDEVHHIGVSPEWLEFEITETALMEYHEASLASLDLLRDHGFRVSIDDFGSGYSSLSKIAHLPVHAIKIDREFVAGLPADEKKGKIIQTILSLASSLELTVVAEGVETEAQLAFLRERGCQVFQGFLFSEARPASGFELLPGKTLPLPA